MRFALAFLFVIAAVVSVNAQGNQQNSQEILRQRLLLKERFNKGWEIETANDRIVRCNAEAKRRYSALRPIKRRRYVKNCVGR
jgi:hypothetical protein